MSMSKVLLNCHTYLLPRIRENKNKPWWFQRQDFHACVQYSNWSWNWNVLKWVTKYWKVAGEISCGDNSYHSKSVVFVVKIQSSEGTFQQICNKLWKDKLWNDEGNPPRLHYFLFYSLVSIVRLILQNQCSQWNWLFNAHQTFWAIAMKIFIRPLSHILNAEYL